MFGHFLCGTTFQARKNILTVFTVIELSIPPSYPDKLFASLTETVSSFEIYKIKCTDWVKMKRIPKKGRKHTSTNTSITY